MPVETVSELGQVEAQIGFRRAGVGLQHAQGEPGSSCSSTGRSGARRQPGREAHGSDRVPLQLLHKILDGRSLWACASSAVSPDGREFTETRRAARSARITRTLIKTPMSPSVSSRCGRRSASRLQVVLPGKAGQESWRRRAESCRPTRARGGRRTELSGERRRQLDGPARAEMAAHRGRGRSVGSSRTGDAPASRRFQTAS